MRRTSPAVENERAESTTVAQLFVDGVLDAEKTLHATFWGRVMFDWMTLLTTAATGLARLQPVAMCVCVVPS